MTMLVAERITTKMRELFETWALANGWDMLAFLRYPSGAYEYEAAEFAYEAFEAGYLMYKELHNEQKS